MSSTTQSYIQLHAGLWEPRRSSFIHSNIFLIPYHAPTLTPQWWERQILHLMELTFSSADRRKNRFVNHLAHWMVISMVNSGPHLWRRSEGWTGISAEGVGSKSLGHYPRRGSIRCPKGWGVSAGSEDLPGSQWAGEVWGQGLRHIRKKGPEVLEWSCERRRERGVGGVRGGEWVEERPQGIPPMGNDREGWRQVESTVQTLVSTSQDLDSSFPQTSDPQLQGGRAADLPRMLGAIHFAVNICVPSARERGGSHGNRYLGTFARDDVWTAGSHHSSGGGKMLVSRTHWTLFLLLKPSPNLTLWGDKKQALLPIML